MNKILFIHGDEKIKVDINGNLYTDGCYNNKVWDRYLKLSSDITAIFRKETVIYKFNDAIAKFQPLSKSIKFVQIYDRKKNLKSFLSISLYKKNNNIIKNEVKKSDIVIARVPSDDSYIAIKYAKKYNKKCLIEVVGCPFDTLWNHSIKGKLLSFYSYFQLRKYVKKGDYVQYVTNSFLQKRYPTSSFQLGCSDVDIKDLDKKVLDRRIKKISDFSSKKKIIVGTIGTLDVKYKGQTDVMKAIKILSKMGYDIEYRLIGAGDSSVIKNVANKIGVNDNCKIIGSLKHELVFDFIDSLDIYIHPSHTEGLCRSLIEVISRGCPCIASDAGGNPELVDDKYIYKKKNVRDLVDTFIKLVSSKDELKKQAIHNFDRAFQYTNNELNIKRNLIYSKLSSNIKSKIKVLHVYNKMDKGGAETFIMNVFREINRKDFDFEFLCTCKEEGAYDKEICELGGKIGYTRLPSLKNFFGSYKDLANYLVINGPYDVIHIPTMFYSGIVCMAAKRAGIPKIIVHSHSAKDRISKNPFRFLYRFIMRRLIFKYSTDKLSCGVDAAKFLYGTTEGITIVNNGIKINNYYNISDNDINKLKKEFLLKDEFIIGNVARFVPIKNQIFFVKLAKFLSEKGFNFKIILVGDGEDKQMIINEVDRNNLNDYFVFAGLRSDIPSFMNLFDVLIMPSLYEGFPLTVIESLSSGTPCLLSSNISKETKIIDNMVDFFNIDGNIEDCFNKIKKLKKMNKIDAKKILMEKNYDISNVVNILENLYRR